MAAPAAPKPAARAQKKTSKKSSADHPSYDVMIIQAVKALNEKKGSSRQAIVKHIRSNHKISEKADNRIKLALKRMEKRGTLTHTTGTGATGSFRVSESKNSGKKTAKPKPKKVKKPAAAKKSAKPKSVKKSKSPAKPKKKTAAAEKPKKPTAAKAAHSPKKAAPPKNKKKTSPKKKSKTSNKGKKPAKK